MKTTTIKTFIHDRIVYTLEKRADNLYALRNGEKTITLATSEESGLEKFAKLEADLKGGENNNMGD